MRFWCHCLPYVIRLRECKPPRYRLSERQRQPTVHGWQRTGGVSCYVGLEVTYLRCSMIFSLYLLTLHVEATHQLHQVLRMPDGWIDVIYCRVDCRMHGTCWRDATQVARAAGATWLHYRITSCHQYRVTWVDACRSTTCILGYKVSK